MNALKTYLVDPIKNHYIDFAGRATRKQYWLYVLFVWIILFVIGLFGDTGVMISNICSLAILLPSLAIAVRRLRDGGFSPWFLLFLLLPVIGWIVLLVLYCLPSKN